MTKESRAFGLASREVGDPAPVLTGVQASGRLDGVLFELTLRQSYRNTSSRVLEVVYTFPLPAQAVLLGFASELNGERKVGTIVAKHMAERLYEAALAEGDAPVMLEALADGLHTANIGNLKPGDEMTLELRFAQLLRFEQGRLRLAIPATIAPRYGSAGLAGLQPQQVPPVSLTAEYPLALAITIAGVLATGTVECPTHRVTREAVDGGLRLDLAPGAWLDRDVVVVVTPREPWPSLVIQAQDSMPRAAPVVVMAALQPPIRAPRPRIVLKLLVDCSGSMGGDSIASARVALHGALAGLTEQDRVSVSRFGSTVDHVLAPSACTPHTLRQLKRAVDAIEADLGGTEMEAALKAVFEPPVADQPKTTDAAPDSGGADVLLVTDGEIWQARETIAAARASGHRVFAIGVGSSPAEGVLRALSEATGGACEFATPGEALEAAAARMLARIRQQPWRGVRIDWGFEPAWQTALPVSVFGGDTVIAFAATVARTSSPTVRLLALDGHAAATEVARGEADAPCPGDGLSRIAAAHRIATAEGSVALALAIDYQLMSQQTHCVLVHQRADADKAREQAELHQVSSMLAAGWGATSSFGAMVSAQMPGIREGLSRPSASRPTSSDTAFDMGAFGGDFGGAFGGANAGEIEAPALLRTQPEERQRVSLKTMALTVMDHLSHGGSVQALAAHGEALEMHADARVALEQAAGLGLSPGDAWLLLAHWVNQRPGGLGDAVLASALQPLLGGIDAKLFARCMKLFDRTLGNYASDGWALSRTRRLLRALTRTSP